MNIVPAYSLEYSTLNGTPSSNYWSSFKCYDNLDVLKSNTYTTILHDFGNNMYLVATNFDDRLFVITDRYIHRADLPRHVRTIADGFVALRSF